MEEQVQISSLVPLYSVPCLERQHMTIFARDDFGRIGKFRFDPQHRRFVHVNCSCCLLVEDLNHLEEPQGARGVKYERYHRDELGKRLICLSLVWQSSDQAKMGIFVGPDGDVANYEWVEETKAFRVVSRIPLFMRVFVGGEDDIIRDDVIVPYRGANCEHGRVLLSKASETLMDVFQYNNFREQFERITCNCKQWKEIVPEVISENCLKIMTIKNEKQNIVIRRNSMKLEKVIFEKIGEEKVAKVIEPAVVRDLRWKSVHQLAEIRIVDEEYYQMIRDHKNGPKNSWPAFIHRGTKFAISESGLISVFNEPRVEEPPVVNEERKVEKAEENDEDLDLPAILKKFQETLPNFDANANRTVAEVNAEFWDDLDDDDEDDENLEEDLEEDSEVNDNVKVQNGGDEPSANLFV